MIKVGIECESIEGLQTWGVGREIKQVLEYIASHPELSGEFKFLLYFKSKIPDYDFLNSKIFEKIAVKKNFMPNSFSLYYFFLLPLKMISDRLDIAYFPNYMLPIFYLRKSLVSLTEDVFYEIDNSNLPLRYRLAYGLFANWAARHATRIMAFSESSKKNLAKLKKLNAERILVNYHGVDIQKPGNAAGKNKYGEFGLYVGQAFPRRHLKETLLGYEKIASRHNNLNFVAVGFDRYRPKIIEKLAGEINNRLGREGIIYKQYVDGNELAGLYSNAKFVVYVSESEAFGLPPIEALGYGSVPIVADSEITKEIFSDNAFFVSNPITPDNIANAMVDAIANKDKINKIQSEAQSIASKFSWASHSKRFLDILRLTSQVSNR